MYAGRLSHHMARARLPEASFLGAERIVEVIGRTSKSKIFGSNVPAIELANVIRKPFSLIHSHPPHYTSFTVIPGLCHPTPIHHLYSPSRILSRDSANRKCRSQTTSSKRRRHRCRRRRCPGQSINLCNQRLYRLLRRLEDQLLTSSIQTYPFSI